MARRKAETIDDLNYQSIDRENSPRDKVFAKFLGILRDNLKSLRVFDVNQDGLFFDCSRFNHSCYPKSEVYYSEPYLRVFAVKEIMEGEEICFSYKGNTFLGTKDLSNNTPPSRSP